MNGRDEATTVRSEEELLVGREREHGGTIGVHKLVDTFHAEEDAPRRRESLGDVERTGPLDGDSGEVEILEDGSVSIPILEEQLVVSRRLVVRERVIVHKTTETEVERIRAELRRERIEIDDADGLLMDDVGQAADRQEETAP
jgi:uncharacterized protein (TIGR02271 family)